jgi:hypothetical protein
MASFESAACANEIWATAALGSVLSAPALNASGSRILVWLDLDALSSGISLQWLRVLLPVLVHRCRETNVHVGGVGRGSLVEEFGGHPLPIRLVFKSSSDCLLTNRPVDPDYSERLVNVLQASHNHDGVVTQVRGMIPNANAGHHISKQFLIKLFQITAIARLWTEAALFAGCSSRLQDIRDGLEGLEIFLNGPNRVGSTLPRSLLRPLSSFKNFLIRI